MPWTASTAPDHVPKKYTKQWAAIANSALADGDDEGTAIRKANGVIKQRKAVAEDKSYVDSYELWDRQYMQEEVQYNPTGGTEGRACATCRWFVHHSDACVLVSGDIMEAGLSNKYEAKVAAEYPGAIPVVIVSGEASAKSQDASKSLVDRVRDFFSTGLRPHPPVQGKAGDTGAGSDGVEPHTLLFKDLQGNTRFFSRVSNNFRDRERETFHATAHEEYKEWVDRTGLYPPLWTWHIPGSQVGQVDWVEYDADTGFLCASGVIDPPFVPILEKALEEGPWGMSHGFYPLVKYKSTGDILQYRSFEFSIVPLEWTANEWTAFNILRAEEKDMAISDKKREALKEKGFTDEMIDGWDQANTSLSARLKAANIEYKEVDEADESAAVLPALTSMASALTAVAESIEGLRTVQGETLTRLGAAEESQKSLRDEVNKSVDDRIADAVKPLVAGAAGMGAGFKASQSAENVDGSLAAKAGNEEFLGAFFGQVAEIAQNGGVR